MILSELIKKLVNSKIQLTVENGSLSVSAPKGAVTPEIIAELKKHQVELISFFQPSGQNNHKIRREDRSLLLELSYAQERLWLVDQIEGDSAHYNIPNAIKLSGPLNFNAVNQAFATILERHESLRTCFTVNQDGKPLQVIQDIKPFSVPITDLTAYEERECDLHVTRLVEEEFARTFDLSRDFMLRANLLKVAEEEHVLLVTMHHIASDGWSLSILINEFCALYGAYVQGLDNPLPALDIQYVDYAQWQRTWLQGEVLEEQLGYWEKQLRGLPVVHSLPLDHPRPSVQSFAGRIYGSHLEANISKALMGLCQSEGATLFMGLHAAFSVLLSRYSNETDIVVGSPIANREQAEVADLIGFFVNTLVLRSDLSATPSFTELLRQSKGMLLDAYAHQQVPFEQLVERLQPERSSGHNALFQIMLVLQNNEEGVLELPGLTLSRVKQTGNFAKYDLMLAVLEDPQGLIFNWEYNTDLFDVSTIERMAEHFNRLLESFVRSPEENVFKVDMLSASERKQFLMDWNTTSMAYPQDSCIHTLFEAQVREAPDCVAVVFEGQQLTYGELNQKANQLAHYLINEKQVKPDTLVGICLERSLEMVIGILGILKAGGAYVPLDPDYPEARLAYMLEDAKLGTVITQREVAARTPLHEGQSLCLDDKATQALLGKQPDSNPESSSGLGSQHLAYVIYTSGSTGNPKGVMVEHYNVTRLLDAAKRDFVFSSGDVWTMFHSYAFDFSVWEIWGALTQGARLIVVPYWVSRSPADFYRLLVQEQVTVLNQTPSAFGSLMHEDGLQGAELALRYVVFGGEALNLSALVPWFNRHGDDQPQLVNMYGITETTVHVTFRNITGEEAARATGESLIGRPLADLQLLLLNEQQALVPVGVAGEMYVGGAGVTRGYLNQPGLTDSRFLSLPAYGAQRFYRTGDLARYLPNGELDYLGRIDHQVKIRGFRIELGEIESALSGHAAVKDAVVVAKEAAGGDKRLVGYVVTDVVELESESEEALSARQSLIEELRQHLGQGLPDYMVPSVFVLLEKLPLTPNGKVDRKGLPEADVSRQQVGYVAPRTETEKILCGIWQEVLGVERVGIHDNFFQLGGHSLTALKLVAATNLTLKANIKVKDIFVTPTIKGLVASADFNQPSVIYEQLEKGLVKINEIRKAIEADPAQRNALPQSYEDLYPLSPIQQGMVFFAQFQPEVPLYHDQFLYNLQLSNFNTDLFKQTITLLSQLHPILRTSFDVNRFEIPIQVVHNQLLVDVILEDISYLPSSMQQVHIESYCALDLKQKFLFQLGEPLWRVRVFVEGVDQICLVLSVQHAILDGWSMNELTTDMAQIYSDLENNIDIKNKTELHTYKDYVAINIERSNMESAHLFWSDYLHNYSRMKLPFNYSGKPISDVAGMLVLRSFVGKDLLQALQQRGQKDGYTIKEMCLAAYVYLLSLLTGDNEILTGVVTNDRPALENADKILGCFLNTIPLRLTARTSINKKELLKDVQSYLQQTKEHELFLADIARLVGEVNPFGNPLFDSLFNFTDFPVSTVTSNMSRSQENMVVDGSEMTNTWFDLEVHKSESTGMTVKIKYAPKYFHQEEMQVASELYINILELLASDQETLQPTSLVKPTACTFNQTDYPYSFETTLHQLFEEQVLRTPHAVALRQNGQELSYAKLNSRSNQIGRMLISRGVRSGDQVGLIMERSFDLIACMFGILKAGAAYVPMEPAYPLARKQAIAESAGLTAILVDDSAVESDELYIPLHKETLSNWSCENINIPKCSLDLAYIIYTSGSTGKPKGVRIAHHAAVNLVSWVNREFAINSYDISLFITSVTFDLSVYDIFGVLSSGGSIVIANQSQVHNPEALIALIQQEKITFWDSVPTTLNHLVSELGEKANAPQVESLRLVFLSGDWIPTYLPSKTNKYFPHAKVISLGGATEGTVWSNYYPVIDNTTKRNSIPYGKPIDNNRFYILDAEQHPVIDGVVGELYIGGVGVANGYQNDPERTQLSFFDDPFVTHDINGQRARMYKTGDLGRLLPCGNMELHGRTDHQVKLRGFRIELNEIESVLNQYPIIKEAVVSLITSDAGASTNTKSQYLVAYVVAHVGEELSTQHIMSYLSEYLPDYMIPKMFMVMDALPLTPNGKINRKALPEPDVSQLQDEYIEPGTETEKVLCDMWQSLLNVEKVGITDNFFQLGGHSLLATRLIAQVIKRFNVEISMNEIFNLQSVLDMGKYVDDQLQLDLGLGTNRSGSMQAVADEEMETWEI